MLVALVIVFLVFLYVVDWARDWVGRDETKLPPRYGGRRE